MYLNYIKTNLSIGDNVEDDFFKIFKMVRPNISKEEFVVKKLNGGFANLLYKAYCKNEPKNSVVFRTFKGNFDEDEIEKFFNNKIKEYNIKENDNVKEIYLNREIELKVMEVLSKYNLCEPIYAKYSNGICFGFAQGVTCDGPLMLTYDYLNIFASKLAKFHSIKIDLPNCGYDTHFELSKQYSSPSKNYLKDFFESEIDKIKEFPFIDFPKLSVLIEIEHDINSRLEKIGFGETGLCHNDMNKNNVIWDPQKRDLKFIDFEQSMNNYVGYDIGYFYVSMTGNFLGDVDESLFPNENYRLKFVRKYLEEKYKIKNEKIDEEAFEEEVKKLNIRSNLFALTFLVRVISLTLFFGFKPELFRKDDFDKLQNSINCGLHALKILELIKNLKPKLIKSYEEYFRDDE